MEQTFNFTVKLSHPVYVALLNESKKREGSAGAVPSRTARQLIEERLEEINAPTPEPPTYVGEVTEGEQDEPVSISTDVPQQKKSYRRKTPTHEKEQC